MFLDLAIALGLGLLVGLQRETAKTGAAGLRTFALVTLCGAVSALLARVAGGWVLGVALIAVAALATVGHFVSSDGGIHSGLTTEMAFVAMFLVGASVIMIDRRAGVVLGGTIAVLLQAKAPLRKVLDRLGPEEVRAIMLFALISLVILPVLPNMDFGPWRTLNAFEIWLLVVLIVGINLAGYIIYKFVGPHMGALLGGLLGGMISSTATTVSYSRRTRDNPDSAPLACVVMMIATAVVLVRVLFEVSIVAPGAVWEMLGPISIVLVAAMILSLLVWSRVQRTEVSMPDQENPTMLRAALAFGALYVVVLLAVAFVKERMSDAGLYVVAAVSGLTDVDAITLSIGRMTKMGEIDVSRAWRLILIAYAANLLFKIGIVAAVGSRRLLARVALLFGIVGVVSAAVILFYP